MSAEIVVSAFIGAIAGIIVDFIFKLYLENLFKFHFRNCDVVLLNNNLSKTEVQKMFSNNTVIKPIHVGNELYWGIDFKDSITLVAEELLGDTSGFLYITHRGKKLLKKGGN